MIKSLSIIFPVFNEESRLKSSFRHIASFLKKKKKFKIEIIFVDDGSKDNSYNLIDQFILVLHLDLIGIKFPPAPSGLHSKSELYSFQSIYCQKPCFESLRLNW